MRGRFLRLFFNRLAGFMTCSWWPFLCFSSLYDGFMERIFNFFHIVRAPWPVHGTRFRFFSSCSHSITLSWNAYSAFSSHSRSMTTQIKIKAPPDHFFKSGGAFFVYSIQFVWKIPSLSTR
jgi:hypothetical protein